MPQVTTANSLTDFDLCLALGQKAINTQLKHSWDVWIKKPEFQKKFLNEIKIYKLRNNANQVVDSKYGVTVKLDPPTIDLNVPDAKLAQVKVNLTLVSGKVDYYDEETEQATSFPIQNWSISFVCNLDKEPVQLDKLKEIDGETAKTATEVIQGSGLSESVFSIEYLFLKLTDVNLLLAGNRDIKIPASVPSSASTKAFSCLNLLLQGDVQKLMMGTVVRRNSKQATPTFAMTDFIFDVRPHKTVANASTLNYLGMFSRAPLPEDPNAARLKLTDPWVAPEKLDGKTATVSGVMAIGGRSFVEKYLIPKFKAALRGVEWESVLGTSGIGRPSTYQGPDPVRKGLTWTFTELMKTGKEMPDAIGTLKIRLEQGYALAVTVQPSADTRQVSISGRIECNVYLDGHFPITDWITQSIHVRGHQDFSGGLCLTGNGSGIKFNLESKLQYEFAKPVLDEKKVEGAATLEFISKLLKGLGFIPNTAEELFQGVQQKTSEKLMGTLQRALDQLNMDLRQHCFIPPGGGVFTFQSPCFSNAGDLFMDVLYIRS